MIPAHKDRVFGLDLLRASAIWLVLWSHAISCFGLGGDSLQILIYIGFLGVDLFFVLSGFLVGGMWLKELEREPENPALGRFIARRWFRTFPNYYLFLAINYLLAKTYSNGMDGIGYYLFFSQCLAWPIANDGFIESWTLCVEEWFYVLFPLCVLALHNLLGARRGFLAAVIVFLAVPATLKLMLLPAPFIYESRNVLTMLDAIALGALSAFVKAARPDIWRRSACLWPCAIPIVGLPLGLMMLGWLPASRLEQFAYLSLPPFAAFFLLPALVRIPGEIFPAATAVRLSSLWSYALYVVHLPVARIMQGEGLVHWSLQFERLAPVVIIAIYLTACIALSAILYYAYERPMMNLREKLA